jgi:hypothetical protein
MSGLEYSAAMRDMIHGTLPPSTSSPMIKQPAVCIIFFPRSVDGDVIVLEIAAADRCA